MSLTVNASLPSPRELKAAYPVPPELAVAKARRDMELADVFTGTSDKFIAVVGPCSADNEDAVCAYMERLAGVAERIAERVIVVPRVYTNKPRTTGLGYKGMLHQPSPTGTENMYAGLIACRQLHLHVMEITGLVSADEMLYPENRGYMDDILGYEAVGARSAEDQQHRLAASTADIPVGLKNPTSGDLSVMINSIKAAQASHRFIYRGEDVTSSGNPLSHAILRGGVDKYGTSVPNYHYEDLARLLEMYGKSGLVNPAVIVDVNHSNSNKRHREQVRIVAEVLHSRRMNDSLRALIKGVMIESYLVEGRQDDTGPGRTFGQSITDPCLGWEDTERLLLSIAEDC